MVQSCAVEKITKTLQNIDWNSQLLIITKCKLLKQFHSAVSLLNQAQCKDFTRKDLCENIYIIHLNNYKTLAREL